MAHYAIGDIQGCYSALRCLLEQCDFDPANDKLWLCGDLINRGPESLETLRFIYQLRERVVTVLGNHDLHLLAVARGFREAKGKDTLDEILTAPDAPALLAWLRRQPLVHHDPVLNYTLVHAGIPPQWSVAAAVSYSREVAAVLQSEQIDDYFAQMYGDTPDCWDDSLHGPERWRLITNYFTRMRFCDAQGRLELRAKEGPDQPPAGFAPWYSHPQRKARRDKIIFGHWAALNGATDDPNVIALDTGCVWGGQLTAYRLEDGALFHCECGEMGSGDWGVGE